MMLGIKVPWKIGKTHTYTHNQKLTADFMEHNEEDDLSSQGVSNAGKGIGPHN